MWRDARVVDLEGVPIRISAPPYLVAVKHSAGLPNDEEHIAALLRFDPSSGAKLNRSDARSEPVEGL
jgi:hypothetical protein